MDTAITAVRAHAKTMVMHCIGNDDSNNFFYYVLFERSFLAMIQKQTLSPFHSLCIEENVTKRFGIPLKNFKMENSTSLVPQSHSSSDPIIPFPHPRTIGYMQERQGINRFLK